MNSYFSLTDAPSRSTLLLFQGRVLHLKVADATFQFPDPWPVRRAAEPGEGPAFRFVLVGALRGQCPWLSVRSGGLGARGHGHIADGVRDGADGPAHRSLSVYLAASCSGRVHERHICGVRAVYGMSVASTDLRPAWLSGSCVAGSGPTARPRAHGGFWRGPAGSGPGTVRCRAGGDARGWRGRAQGGVDLLVEEVVVAVDAVGVDGPAARPRCARARPVSVVALGNGVGQKYSGPPSVPAGPVPARSEPIWPRGLGCAGPAGQARGPAAGGLLT
jgi:hypothetical protein